MRRNTVVSDRLENGQFRFLLLNIYLRKLKKKKDVPYDHLVANTGVNMEK